MTADEQIQDVDTLAKTLSHVPQSMMEYTDADRKYNNSEMRLNRKRLQAGDLISFFSNLTALFNTIETELLPAADELSRTGLRAIGVYIPFITTWIAELSSLIACITFFRRYHRNKDKVENLIAMIEVSKQYLAIKTIEINQQQAELEILFKELQVSTDSASKLPFIYQKFNKLAEDLTDYFNILDHFYYLVDLQTIIESAYRIGWANFITGVAVGVATVLFSPVGGILVSHVCKTVRTTIPQGCSLFKKITATLNLRKNFSQRYEIKDTAICNFVAGLDMNIQILDKSDALQTTAVNPVATERTISQSSVESTQKINPHYVTLKQQLMTYRSQIQLKKDDFEARKNNSGIVGRGIYSGKRSVALGGTIIFTIGIVMLFIPFPGPQLLAPLLMVLGDCMMTYGNAQAIYSRNQISLQGLLKKPHFAPLSCPQEITTMPSLL